MFKWLRGKEPEQRKKPTLNVVSAVQKHKTRISNLEEELEICVCNLKALHSDSEIPVSIINKEANAMITRMTFIKYELGIREDLIKWL
jgi:hypothetical protein